jgi:hypothetical protein
VNDRFWIVKEADEHYWYAEKEGAHSLKSKKVSKSDVEFEQSDGESNGAEKRGAAGAPALQKKSRTGALVGDTLSNALVVDDESEAEGAERSLDAAAPRHMQAVCSPSFKKPAKEALPHAEMPGNVDAEIPRFALTVGINNYTHLGTLPYCRQDAMAMAEELKKHNFRVHTLVDCEKADMDREMDKWLEELPASSPCVAVLHFSGHGYEIDGENFLVPNDADCKTQDDVKNKCISLKKMLKNIGSKFGGSILVILLLDCCRAGMKNPNLKSSFAKLEVTSHLTRTFVGHATAPSTLAQADHHRCPNLSPFTYALVDCLKNSEIASQDIGVFFRAVRGLVEDLTGGKQRPFEESNLRESFRFKEVQQESNVTAGGGGRRKHSEKAEQLAQMGFDKARALEILDIVDGSVELALDMLSS